MFGSLGGQATIADDTPTNTDSLIGFSLGGGRYRVIGPLGSGGAGAVYRAVQEPLGRQVAVKVLRADLSDDVRSEFEPRFLREAAMAGRLKHPNLITMFDYGVEPDGTHFMVMELLEGVSVLERLRALGRPMDPRVAARIGAGVARGLHHAHQHGMIHRDVKTSNVMLIHDVSGEEKPILVDFGLAKPENDHSREHDLTTAGTFLGTPSFMSPEQFSSDNEIDHRSDLYSLGCSLYQMTTLRKPFRSKSAFQLGMMHQTQPVPAMKDRNPTVDVDPVFEAIVVKCMEKEREDRFGSAAALAEALESFADGPWVAAPTTESVGRNGALVRRSVAAVALLALVTVGAFVALEANSESPATPLVVEPTPELAPMPVALPEPAPAPDFELPSEVVKELPEPKPSTVAPSALVPNLTTANEMHGVGFSDAHAAKLISFLNTSTMNDMRRAGLTKSQVDSVAAARPFVGLPDLSRASALNARAMHNLSIHTR
jgi:serine/threonine protein kinase